MNAFDYSIITFLNAMAQKSALFNGLTARIDSYLFKGGNMMAFFWWAWFAAEGKVTAPISLETGKLESKKRKQDVNRESLHEGKTFVDEWRFKLIAVALGSMVSLFVARILAGVLPFRPDPDKIHFWASLDGLSLSTRAHWETGVLSRVITPHCFARWLSACFMFRGRWERSPAVTLS